MKGGRLRRFAAGFRYGVPVMLGYAPVAFAFAVAAVGNGLPWPIVVLISLTNLTSAGQQAGAGLLIAGAPFPELAVTVLIINIRYMLMSLSLSQKMLKIPLAKRLLLANGVTDEIFFLAMQKEELSGWFFTGLSFGPYLGWGLGTLAGALAGTVLPASLSSALGIALYAMFIAIVVPQARKERPALWVTLIAVGLSCAFRYLPLLDRVPSGWALIISAVAAAVAGGLLFPLPEQKEATV
ncbi:MAG: AzlC family ABC transporter permease [Acutalibacteraceae bacterium]|jgi:4-azaleucine resistance transporter AzlC